MAASSVEVDAIGVLLETNGWMSEKRCSLFVNCYSFYLVEPTVETVQTQIPFW